MVIVHLTNFKCDNYVTALRLVAANYSVLGLKEKVQTTKTEAATFQSLALVYLFCPKKKIVNHKI